MIIIKPISTNIRQIVKTKDNYLIIREDSYNFKGLSNVYCLKESDIIWYAELPNVNHYYSNDLLLKDDNLQASTWEGDTVEINIKTGQIMNEKFTK